MAMAKDPTKAPVEDDDSSFELDASVTDSEDELIKAAKIKNEQLKRDVEKKAKKQQLKTIEDDNKRLMKILNETPKVAKVKGRGSPSGVKVKGKGTPKVGKVKGKDDLEVICPYCTRKYKNQSSYQTHKYSFHKLDKNKNKN